MSHKILVPIDFSINANTAIQFAIDVAEKRGYSIHLYHNYTVASSSFDNEKDEIPEEGFKADVLMSDLMDQLKTNHPAVLFTSTCERGIITESLLKVTKNSDYLAIVIGTKGKTDDTSVIMGSTAYAVSQKSSIPVIAIPFNYKTKDIKKIGLLSNFKYEELDTLNEYIKIFGTDVQVKIIHVHYHKESEDDIENKLEIWKYQIKKHTQITKVDIEVDSIKTDIEELDTIPEVINDIIKEEAIDVVLITKTRRSFFERLFKKSVSKQIIHHPIIPTFFSKA
ncbi:universal stress protein [Sphingobacterium sp. SRCM116780]|uniref:universal stress protein n=1 Tax=Sphingobacterium sp. SRCM116780 TaxID=2907623 RepID=UPI001F26905B|nr:universal stress protein [Sphingobacterium sp. SRCM116780]UIR56568.1 universal stress protein [Sphingobacterium sp. SRCM116780]